MNTIENLLSILNDDNTDLTELVIKFECNITLEFDTENHAHIWQGNEYIQKKESYYQELIDLNGITLYDGRTYEYIGYKFY